MDRSLLKNLLFVPVFAAMIGGCGQTVPDVGNPIGIATDEYDDVFNATVDILREKRYTVDRKDRRFGVVTTSPRIAASVVEPWYDDNSTPDQIASSTFNLQRRTIRVEIQPAKVPDAAQGGAIANRYQLFVQVDVDRRHHPPRALNTSALGSVRVRNAEDRNRAVFTERGREESVWTPVGRDPHLEARLVADILNRAVGYQAPPPTPADPDTDSAPDGESLEVESTDGAPEPESEPVEAPAA